MKKLPKALLEEWMRQYYFTTTLDIGSSGVRTFSLAELRKLADITQIELDAVFFNDSWTSGSIGLRQAIANRWGNGQPNTVMVGNGSNEILYMLASTILNPNDEVVILQPYYHVLWTIAENIGCQIKWWKLLPENHFKPNIDDLKSLITPKTKLIAVNFPHNPTGISITRQQQDELIRAASEVGAYLIWDAAFEDIVEKEPLPNPCLIYKNAISIGTLSKGYGLPGIRIGWCFAPSEIIEDCMQLRDYMTLYVSPLLEIVGQRAIEKLDRLLDIRMQEVQLNLSILEKWIEKHKSYVEWVKPNGGVTAFVKIIGQSDTEEFCRCLAKKHSVMLVPGNCFGYPQYVRLGFGASTEEFKKGLDYLSVHLADS
ncbi:MAG: capreomycidine synthase [Cyanobacteria bacterium SBLK]|nr:capreomycidine synthase [Cyanobacteria bacterium SBLK]